VFIEGGLIILKRVMRLGRLLLTLVYSAMLIMISLGTPNQEHAPTRFDVDAGFPPIFRSSDDPQPLTPGPEYFDQSEFMIGSIAVGVFLVESQGHDFDWTDSEVDETLQGIYAGLSWLASVEPAAHLSFSYELHLRQPTSYEPIERSIHDDVLWVDEIMSSLNYSDPGPSLKVRRFNNDLRARLETDWAYSIFVVDSNDTVNMGRFADNEYGWGYYGGPWFVMSRYSSWAYNSPDYYRAVPAHETGHIFYATDEYDSYPVEYSGYLNCPDSNGAIGIMNMNTLYVSASTRCQIGWMDSDGDGILDIVDVPPETTLVPNQPDPTNDCEADYSGIATVVALPNQNPRGQKNDITVSRIAGVEYRVNGGNWLLARADDASFDDYEEDFSFVTPQLPQGLHNIEVRAINTEDNADDSPSSDTLDTRSSFCSEVNALPKYVNLAIMQVSASSMGSISSVELWFSREGSVFALYSIDTVSPWEWRFNMSAAGGDGFYRFFSIAVNDSGNREPLPADHDASTTRDTLPPSVSIQGPQASQWLNSSSVTVRWAGNDARSGIDWFSVSLDSSPVMNVGQERNHTFVGVAEGHHRAFVNASDLAGNLAAELVEFGIDMTPPLISVIAPGENQVISGSTIEVSWNGSDALSGIAYFEVRLDENSFIRVDLATIYNFSGVSDGLHNVTIVAWDISGNSRNAYVSLYIENKGGDAIWPWILIAVIVTVGLFVAAILMLHRRRQRDSTSALELSASSQDLEAGTEDIPR